MDGLETLLPGAGLFGVFGVIITILIRFVLNDRKLLSDADRRYQAEVAQHEATERLLDEERAARRKVEDDLGRQLRELRDEVHTLRSQLAALTGGKVA